MKLTRLLATLAILFCITSASAQKETPTANPTLVVVKGRMVSHSWRDGRIWVPTSDLQPLLNMSCDFPSMDLLKTLEEKGGYIWQVVDGRFEAKPDPSKSSQAANASASRNDGGADYQVAKQRLAKAFTKSPKLNSHPDLARVEKIGQQLVAASDMPTLSWNFFIVHDSEPNAFCCGAGWVAVTDGLLALKLSDNELAGVLAHEIGHGCRKDLEEGKFNREQMARYGNEAERLDQELQALLRRREKLLANAQHALDLAELAVTSGEASRYNSQANSLVREAKALDRPIKKLDKAIGTNVKGYKDKEVLLTQSVFAQKDEYDADIKGIYYATKAGFGATGLMDSLKKLAQARAKRFGAAAFQGGFSHPPVAARIETMNKVLKDWRNQR